MSPIRRPRRYVPKTVYVHRYRRFRFGRWEDVCAHYRSHPSQLMLNL